MLGLICGVRASLSWHENSGAGCRRDVAPRPGVEPGPANTFSQFVGFVSILFMVSFAVQRLVSLIRSSLFVFISIVLGN